MTTYLSWLFVVSMNIALPVSSVDAVVAAHCFHWFANHDAVKEICRVLTPAGSLGMIWAMPDESLPWVKDVLALEHCAHWRRTLSVPSLKKPWGRFLKKLENFLLLRRIQV